MVHLMCLGLDGFFFIPLPPMATFVVPFFFLLFPFVPCHVYYQPGWIESGGVDGLLDGRYFLYAYIERVGDYYRTPPDFSTGA